MKHLGFRGLAAAMALGALGGAAQAETVLTFNWWVPPTHLMRTEIMGPWAEEVAQATNGAVRIEFTATSMGPPPRQMELVQDGVVDLALGVHGYTPDRFVNSGVMELPFMNTTGEAASGAYWRAYEKYFAATGEHAGVRVLAHYVHSPGTVMSRDKPLGSLADFDGLLVRSGGGVQDRVTSALGASVVSSPAPTTYELMANGVVDATLMTPDGYTSFNLSDHVKVQLLVPGGLFNSSFFVVMNEDAYNRIPEEHRAAFDALTGEYLSRMGGRGFDTVSNAGLAKMEADGGTIITADEAMVAEIKARVSFLEDEWKAAVQARHGLDGAEIIDFLRAEMALDATD